MSAVIVVLLTLTLFAVNAVFHSTKVTKTRATIQKLDVALQQIFGMYEEKFAAVKRAVARDYPDIVDEEEQQKIAAHFIRDLMRMEMPQCWAEVLSDPLVMMLNSTNYSVEALPLLEYYREAYNNAAGTSPCRAALLFLIVQNLNPEALEAFHGSEVAANADGLLEFVDAWGRPIQFLRWVPGFLDSDLLRKDIRDPTDEREDAAGWLLYPLIYSAGHDGKYGIDDGGETPPTLGGDGILDPFDAPYSNIGAPDGTKGHFDNIHNHLRYRSF